MRNRKSRRQQFLEGLDHAAAAWPVFARIVIILGILAMIAIPFLPKDVDRVAFAIAVPVGVIAAIVASRIVAKRVVRFREHS